jgi:hypothetical protein
MSDSGGNYGDSALNAVRHRDAISRLNALSPGVFPFGDCHRPLPARRVADYASLIRPTLERIAPDGQITSLNPKQRQSGPRKIFYFRFSEKYDYPLPSRLHKRGVSRSSRTLEAGCGGCEGAQRALARRRKYFSQTAKPCGPDTPMLVSSLRAISQATGPKSPEPRGERGAAVKTIAQGMPGVPAALSLLACAKCTFFARKARGCGQHPAFPAPSSFRGPRMMHHPGMIVPRERGGVVSSCTAMTAS